MVDPKVPPVENTICLNGASEGAGIVRMVFAMADCSLNVVVEEENLSSGI